MPNIQNPFSVAGTTALKYFDIKQDLAERNRKAQQEEIDRQQRAALYPLQQKQAELGIKASEQQLQAGQQTAQRQEQADIAKTQEMAAASERLNKAVLAGMAHIDNDKGFAATSFGKIGKTALLNNDLDSYYDAVGKYEESKAKKESEQFKLGQESRASALSQRNVMQGVKLDAKESEKLAAVFEAKDMLNTLVKDFKEKGYGGAGQIPKETAAKIPVLGKYISTDAREYQNTKRRIAETYLRAATGAAAPEKEVETYMNFLPDQSDPIDVADKKLDIFKTKISAEALSRAKLIRLEGETLIKAGNIDMGNGKVGLADALEKSINDTIGSIEKIGISKAPDKNAFIQNAMKNGYSQVEAENYYKTKYGG